MGVPKLREWSLDDFLAWEERQPARYELVDGHPVMMAGGTQAHTAIAVNLLSTLKGNLRGSPCRPGNSDLKVLTGSGNVRYPDVSIDCGPFRPDQSTASEPVVVFEVLSKSTAWVDWHKKLDDYGRTPTIRHYVLVAQEERQVVVWSRGESGHLFLDATAEDPEGEITLGAVGLTLRLAEIYDGLVFEPASAPETGAAP